MLLIIYMLNHSEINIPFEKQPIFIFKKPCYDCHILLDVKEVYIHNICLCLTSLHIMTTFVIMTW